MDYVAGKFAVLPMAGISLFCGRTQRGFAAQAVVVGKAELVNPLRGGLAALAADRMVSAGNRGNDDFTW